MPYEEKNVLREELKAQVNTIVKDDYEFGFHDDDVKYTFKARKGLDEAMVRQISALKSEPHNEESHVSHWIGEAKALVELDTVDDGQVGRRRSFGKKIDVP